MPRDQSFALVRPDLGARHARLRVIVHRHRAGQHVVDPRPLQPGADILENVEFGKHARMVRQPHAGDQKSRRGRSSLWLCVQGIG